MPSPLPADKRFVLLSLAGLGLYAAFFTCMSLARFYGLMSQGLDLGVFDQLMWSIIHRWGAPISTLNPPFTEQHWLGFHFSPILYLLVPIYYMFPHPETLLVLNVFFLSSMAIPIYLIARHWQMSPAASLVWSAATIVNPFCLSAVIWDFHEVSIAAPVMGFALYAIATRNFRLLVIMSFLLLLTKEHYALSVAGMGLLWSMEYKEWRRGRMITLAAATAAIAIIFLIMPALHDTTLPYTIQGRFSWLTDPFAQGSRFYILLLLGAVVYVGLLVLPFWFLPLYALPWLLPAASDLIVNILSSDNMMHSMYSYHSTTLIPVLSVAAMRAANKLVARNPKLKMIELTVLVAINSFALGYANAPAPLPGSANLWETDMHNLSAPYRADIRNINAILLENAALSVQDNAASFFTQRARIYDFPGGLDTADAVILHVHFPLQHSQSLFGAPLNLTARVYTGIVSNLLRQEKWHVTYWHNGWLLLQKRKPPIAVDKNEIEKALVAMSEDYARAGKPTE